MTFLRGFFLVSFLPFGIMILAGVWLFFRCNCKQEKWYYPLLFIISVLIAISLWRIPVVIDRRYAMPILVPGIVISTFVLILLPGILDKFKVSSAKAITRIIIVGLLIACVAKAMRPQESKEYLHEIAEAIKQDCQKNNIKNNVVLLVFGNPGGHLELDNKIKLTNITNKNPSDRLADAEYQINLLKGTLAPELLKIQYPYLYLLCVEKTSGNFKIEWGKTYHDELELLFEYINARNQTAYRMYRVKSPYKPAWYSEQELDKFLKENNILTNGDFSKKVKISSNAPSIKLLRKNGIDLTIKDDFYLPEGWEINPSAGWMENCMPADIKIGNRGHALEMRCAATISLFSNAKIPGGQKYVIFVKGGSAQDAIVSVLVFKYIDNKYAGYTPVIVSELDDSSKFFMAGFDLTTFNGYARLALYLSSGFAWFDKVYIVPMDIIESAK